MDKHQSKQVGGPRFSVIHSLKLGCFHIGSSMTDLLASAVWNRIMVVDLGVAAWPVALLTAMRYLLSPLILWVGHRSDTRPIFGSHRLAYIWLGRLLMLVSLPLLPLSTVVLAENVTSGTGWGMAIASFLLYGIGTLISGAPFLALVHDSAPYARRGQALGIVQFVLVTSFAFIPMLYAMAMPSYDPVLFRQLVIIAIGGAALFWFFSILGEERRTVESPDPKPVPSFRAAFSALWSQLHTRRYALFLGLSAYFAFMQDAVLEPFGGDVFGLTLGETTLFNAFWGAGVLVGMIATLLVTRQRKPDQQVSTTGWGLAVLGIMLLLLGLTSLLEAPTLVRPVLVLFGLGFGIFAVGGVSLLMAMSVEKQAGSYLALWTMIQLVSRGLGIATGGAIRDLVLTLGGSYASAYAAVFIIEAVGIFFTILLLRRVDIVGFTSRRVAQVPL